MSSAKIKKEMKFLNNQIQELMLISSKSIADGKVLRCTPFVYFNQRK